MLVRLAGAYTFPNGLSTAFVPSFACDSSHKVDGSFTSFRLRRDGKKGPS